MSKILLGAGISEISGRISGTTFQRSQYGQQAEGFSYGTIRSTHQQSKVRSALRFCATEWGHLTTNERASWRNATVNGRSGYTLYMHYNIPLVSAGSPLVRSFPNENEDLAIEIYKGISLYKSNGQLNGFKIYIRANKGVDVGNIKFKVNVNANRSLHNPAGKVGRHSATPSHVTIEGSSIILEMKHGGGGAGWCSFPHLFQSVWVQILNKGTSQPITNEASFFFRTQPYITTIWNNIDAFYRTPHFDLDFNGAIKVDSFKGLSTFRVVFFYEINYTNLPHKPDSIPSLFFSQSATHSGDKAHVNAFYNNYDHHTPQSFQCFAFLASDSDDALLTEPHYLYATHY